MRALTAYTDDLFAPAMHQLVDDAQGGIRYWPDVIDPATAQRWFDLLHTRGVDAPAASDVRPHRRRAEAAGELCRGRISSDDLPLAQLLACLQARAPAPYTRIGMNLYRDGQDSVAMHGDKLHGQAAGHPITLVSLGAPRRMLIRAREGRRETLAVDLAPGSVLSMSHASQSTHEHGIPKTRRAQGPRISVVFRVRPA